MSSGAFADFVCDVLRPLGDVRGKRMFSGTGLFCDGLMFGLILDDVLYLKTDADGAEAFKVHGMAPFVYEAKGRRVALGYWRAPEHLLDDPEELQDWGRKALATARAAARTKAKRRRPGSQPQDPGPRPGARPRKR